MNKFFIAFSALLAVFSVCDAYGQRPVYGARPSIGGVAYQLQPAASVYSAPLVSGYGAPLLSGYGAPLAQGYGAQLPISGYGASLPGPNLNQLLALGGGYGSNLNLAQRALALPNLPAIYNQDAIIQPSVISGQASPLILPAPVGSSYSLPASPQRAEAAAVAKAGNRVQIPLRSASLVAAPRAIVGPARGYGSAPVVSAY